MNEPIKFFGNILLLFMIGNSINDFKKGKREIKYEECAQDRQDWVKKHEKTLNKILNMLYIIFEIVFFILLNWFE